MEKDGRNIFQIFSLNVHQSVLLSNSAKLFSGPRKLYQKCFCFILIIFLLTERNISNLQEIHSAPDNILIMRRIKQLFLILASLHLIVAADRCATSNLFECPNCGGILVSDCLECDGYLNTGKSPLNGRISRQAMRTETTV